MDNRSFALQFGFADFSDEFVFGGSSSGDDGERNASDCCVAGQGRWPEVSSRRVSPSPEGPKSSAPTSIRPGELKNLLERASISEDHRALMCMVIGRISSAESGLRNAAKSLLAGFEVRKNDAPFLTVLHIKVRPV